MKIKLADDKVIDTDKLSDRDAEIHEALDHLYKVCERYNIIALSRVVLNNKEHIGMLHLPQDSDEKTQQSYNILVAGLAEWISKTSEGRLQVIGTEEDFGSSQES